MHSIDDIFAALPQVDLCLWILSDNGSDGWYAALCEEGRPSVQFHGNGATAADALARALEDAGVKVDG